MSLPNVDVLDAQLLMFLVKCLYLGKDFYEQMYIFSVSFIFFVRLNIQASHFFLTAHLFFMLLFLDPITSVNGLKTEEKQINMAGSVYFGQGADPYQVYLVGCILLYACYISNFCMV